MIAKKAVRWRIAKEEADMVLNAAIEDGAPSISAIQPVVDVSAADVASRIRRELMIHRGRSYVGSTSDPLWRWRGGWYWRSEGGRAASEPSDQRAYMQGHCHEYKLMIVVGTWRDSECANMEKVGIGAGKRFGGRRMNNKAHDARGLEIRSYGYSFLYICFTHGGGRVARIPTHLDSEKSEESESEASS